MSGAILASSGAYIAEWIGFVLVIGVIAWKVAPFVVKALNQRRTAVETSISGAAELRQTAEQELERRQQLLEEARREAVQINQRARETAEQLRAEGVQRGEEERRRVAEAAETEIALRRARAVEEIAEMAGAVVVEAASRVVRGEVDPARQRALVGEAIAAAESTGSIARGSVR